VVLVVEAAGGFAAHSLALLSDAGHVLTDVIALGLAWFAVARRGGPPIGAEATGTTASASSPPSSTRSP